ncbi:hypothetical protein M7I_2140 [Glarea lozoyensis 74030]|uniref:Uncharacterized protein n=1 Tax=Glarea lozoyensis (strain ATCC 74030 / MF5533) TaxID=1104152 RepID=H0EHZ6_GLAL7|nr:hypothetical protein M7I_2140 [Glarea lozoyensis 74030]
MGCYPSHISHCISYTQSASLGKHRSLRQPHNCGYEPDSSSKESLTSTGSSPAHSRAAKRQAYFESRSCYLQAAEELPSHLNFTTRSETFKIGGDKTPALPLPTYQYVVDTDEKRAALLRSRKVLRHEIAALRLRLRERHRLCTVAATVPGEIEDMQRRGREGDMAHVLGRWILGYFVGFALEFGCA